MLLTFFATTLLLGVLPSLAVALPTDTLDAGAAAAAATSAHNIYLVSCVPRTKNDDDEPPTTPAQNFTAIAYFKTPINATDSSSTTAAADKAPKPDKAALVSQPPQPWEGVKWSVKVWKDKTFTANIAAGARDVGKAGYAGSAKLDTEEFACFADGETAVRIREDDVRGNCVADYWCAGFGKGDGGA